MSLKGFFAYPNDKRISDTITAFAEKLNGSQLLQMETWEDMQIGGKLLMSEICNKIDESDLFCADITRLNPNVLFEIGFAIARKKRIWLVRDNSIPAENSDFRQFKILTTLGYREYLSSNDIIHAYYKDLPHDSLEETVYDQVIEPSIRYFDDQHVLYLKAYYEDEASVKVTQHVDYLASNQSLSLLIDDPRETSIQPLTWYAKNVHTAKAVICHLTTVERENSKIQNAKHSLVAGLAHGFEVPLLLLIECEPLGPADYRDLLFSYKKAKDAISRIETFLGPILHEKKQTERYQYQEQRKKRDVEELAMLRIGEPIAEHEEDGLIESAFIETAAYHAALNSSQNVFVGRKGVGKTANFKKLSKVLAQDKRNLVCEIKPLSYELEALLAVAKRFELISKKGFLFESLWKFLIYSEIAKQVAQAIEARVSGEIFANETKLMKLLADNSALLSLDFAARLDTLSKSLLDSSLEDSQAPDATFAVSELLHSGIIKELVDSLSQALNNKNRIVVLIDNLDKAWDKSENTRFLSYFFLGLLSALRRIANDFKNRPMGKDVIQLSLCLFVRTDIFDIVLEQAREPDKIQHQRLSWDDRDRLRMLADYRLVAAAGAGEINIQPEKIWKRFFATTISGKELFDYIFSVILMRPRDLLFFLRSAISAAVSRRHDLVREDDFLRAEDDYSNFAFQSMLVELRDKLPEIEEILAEFMGSYAVLTELDIRESILKDDSRSELDFNSIIAGLTLSSFFEIEVPTKGFVGVSDERDYLRLYRAASNLSARDKMPIRFRIHRAFWKALLVVDAGEAQ